LPSRARPSRARSWCSPTTAGSGPASRPTTLESQEWCPGPGAIGQHWCSTAGIIRRTAGAIALVGKVYCRVDSAYAPIEVGDLLTTSPTRGHAMRVVDPSRAFGAIIGKALRPLSRGAELIPILVSSSDWASDQPAEVAP
jgi:hypothetical protein